MKYHTTLYHFLKNAYFYYQQKFDSSSISKLNVLSSITFLEIFKLKILICFPFFVLITMIEINQYNTL